MPTKKQPSKTTNTAPAKTAGATPATTTEKPAAAADNTQAAPAPADPGRTAVIAELVKGGMSYADAVAAVDGGGTQQTQPVAKVNLGKDPGADEVIDPDSIDDPDRDLDLYEIPSAPPEGYKHAEMLYELRVDIEKSRKPRRFSFNVELDQRLTDWLLYACLSEAAFRGRPDLSLNDFIEIRLKELMAADPTKGGRRNPSKSGPRDQYNPSSGNWKP